VQPEQQLAPLSAGGGRRVAGPSDAELLAAVACGSDDAFTELRRRYRGAVEQICRTRSGAAGAEDCAQEAFTRIWQKASLFDPRRGSAAAWLLTVSRNSARNFAAREAAAPVAVDAATADACAETTIAAPVDRFWLEAALERLPHHERKVIELAYFGDRSQTQIAAGLGVPLGTVKSWTRRALNRLATLLGEEVVDET
jgi:RNA polymerase sigma-70 factor (ECF subfamily)